MLEDARAAPAATLPGRSTSIAVTQSELGDRDAARVTMVALDLAILPTDQRLNGVWSSSFTDLAEAQIAVGDHDAAFGTCFARPPADGDKRHFLIAVKQQPWMLARLASAAADANHESRRDAPRRMTAEGRAARLALVRRAVAAVEALPEPNEHRPTLAASLAVLGAFSEALDVTRRIDQKQIREPLAVDSTWALWRISLEQAKCGKFDDARAQFAWPQSTERRPGADDNDRRHTVAMGYIVARDLDEALKVADSLDPQRRATSFPWSLNILRLAGNRRRFRAAVSACPGRRGAIPNRSHRTSRPRTRACRSGRSTTRPSDSAQDGCPQVAGDDPCSSWRLGPGDERPCSDACRGPRKKCDRPSYGSGPGSLRRRRRRPGMGTLVAVAVAPRLGHTRAGLRTLR